MYFETEARVGEEGSSHHPRCSTVNDALELLGTGVFHWSLLGYTSFAIAADAGETMILSFLGPTVVCQFGAGPAQESILTSVVFLGMLLGVYALGTVSDLYGRRKGFLVSALVLGVAGAVSSVAPTFSILVLCRMIVGAGLGGVPIVITLFTEFLPPARRGRLSLLMQSSWAVGTAAQALLAWGILAALGWRWFLFISAVPLFILAGFYSWVPESPYWLFSKGRLKDAEAVLLTAAKYNSVNLKGLQLEQSHVVEEEHDDTKTTIHDTIIQGAKQIRTSIARVVYGHLKGTTKILWFVWFANATLYYGLVLLTTNLSKQGEEGGHTCQDGQVVFDSSEYFAVFITALSEAPGILCASFLVDSKGRLWCLRAGMLLCATCVAVLPFGNRVLQLVLLFVARAAIEGTFCVLYVYTPELYPTENRSIGLALCNGFARVGGFCAPFFTVYLVEQGKFGWSTATLAGICLLSFVGCLFLSIETMGSDLSRDISANMDTETKHHEDEHASLVHSKD
jgi:MFS family permease